MSTLRDLFVDPRGPVSVHHDWSGFSVEWTNVSNTGPYEFSRSGPTFYLALHDMSIADGEIQIDGGEHSTQTTLQDTLTLLPPHRDAKGWCDPVGSKSTYTALYFDPVLIGEALEQYRGAEIEPVLYGRDPALVGTMKKISDVARSGGDQLYADQLCILAAVEALGLRSILKPIKGGLSAKQLACAKDFLHEHQARPISLAELAAHVGLSRHHLTRAFTTSTGKPPFRYLAELRVERAIGLLVNSDQSIAAVAKACGFGDDGNMRRVMQQLLGVGPRQVRQTR